MMCVLVWQYPPLSTGQQRRGLPTEGDIGLFTVRLPLESDGC
jgi:hypothetical protein